MNQRDINEEIVQSLLKDFQRSVRRGWLTKLLAWGSPTEGYAKQYGVIDGQMCFKQPIVRLWHVTAQSIEELPPTSVIPQGVRRSRRFFAFAHFGFCLPTESEMGLIKNYLGPLFGHGRRFTILRKNSDWEIQYHGGWKS